MKFSTKTLLVFPILFFFPFFVFAANYIPLQPITIPGGGSLYGKDILESLKNIYTFAIAVAGGLAVIKIVWAGAKYMLSDVVTNKSDSIKEIQAAVYGLLMALGAFVFLYTLNPNLVKFNLNIKATDVIRGDATGLYNIIQSSGGVGGGRAPTPGVNTAPTSATPQIIAPDAPLPESYPDLPSDYADDTMVLPPKDDAPNSPSSNSDAQAEPENINTTPTYSENIEGQTPLIIEPISSDPGGSLPLDDTPQTPYVVGGSH
jgi:hypothetical protein